MVHLRAGGRCLGIAVVAGVIALAVQFGVGAPQALAATDYRSAVLADAPTGYWRLQERPFASTAIGSSPRAVTLGYAGSHSVSPGPFGPNKPLAAAFHRTPAGAATAAQPALTAAATWSLEAWIEPVGSGRRGVVVYNGVYGTNAGYGFGLGSGSNLVALVGTRVLDSGYTFRPPARWHHIVVTADHFRVRFLVDGQQAPKTAALPATAPAARFSIGAGIDASGALRDGFDGAIAEVAVYASRLPDRRALAHFDAAAVGGAVVAPAAGRVVRSGSDGPIGSSVTSIAAGYSHALALQSDGTVWAWGADDSGQLGDGTVLPTSAPVAVAGLGGVTAIAAGDAFSLALESDGTVWAWGWNAMGQLGNGTLDDSTVPRQVPKLDGVVAIAAGAWYALALRSDGTVWAWGDNWVGELGTGKFGGCDAVGCVPARVAGVADVTAIASGYWHALARTADGGLWTWGIGGDGELGNGQTANSAVPVHVLDGVSAIAGGSVHSLAVRPDGVWAWGGDYEGELGNGGTDNSSVPRPVAGLGQTLAVGCGGTHSLSVAADGSLWAWGSNWNGELGIGPTSSIVPSPVQTHDLSDAIAVAAGYGYSLALESDGTVWAWGGNWLGQLADGTTLEHDVPQRVGLR